MNDYWQDESIGFLMGKTYRKIVMHVTTYLREFDLTPEQFSVLFCLSKQEGINQKELAIRTTKDQPTITRILDALAKKGFIEKKLSETDRRAYLLMLSDKGREWIELATPAEAKAISEVVDGMSEEELQILRQALIRIAENVNRHTKE
ncbi:MarR family winged helix-turn-helix transcriptional regulator [Brevibacillus centrosporus]|uniref:DNA-binding transcriptional regulator, MarR family n=1 Tax=Brevibacillus centrosporus TaxID=54910 RepID=A0A1I3RHE7_9BACL|nr:MarR family transcriptional regulator [Brevibacillus centrosporus]MEC2130320.1 MarR family transcriptional regulator [Brevibacillus centrosporus]MED4909172.1 MarR family transcriptional regulator [Brevibacillus centrosporus]RNB71032.1 MarR family transcriptional regulator [Brevibacillus centrosporus]SFJ44717.1 DNA-binding transcriptional regulator, MarR family [Brevibacillus centrosporus]GED30352.1 MarR family transcriptional regulator [Brevibacillus centrosporus]